MMGTPGPATVYLSYGNTKDSDINEEIGNRAVSDIKGEGGDAIFARTASA